MAEDPPAGKSHDVEPGHLHAYGVRFDALCICQKVEMVLAIFGDEAIGPSSYLAKSNMQQPAGVNHRGFAYIDLEAMKRPVHSCSAYWFNGPCSPWLVVIDLTVERWGDSWVADSQHIPSPTTPLRILCPGISSRLKIGSQLCILAGP